MLPAGALPITVAEPDLQVLAQTVPHIKSSVLLITVGVGVGFFMTVCMLRILTGASLRWLLIACYALIFVLAAFTDRNYLSIAFDSGGVTTGPMTVPVYPRNGAWRFHDTKRPLRRGRQLRPCRAVLDRTDTLGAHPRLFL